MKRHLSALLFLFAALSAAVNAQEPLRPRNMGEVPRTYSAQCDMTLSAAAGACTIQQPASGSNKVRLISATIYCAVDCSLTQRRDGTAATATAATVEALTNKSDTAKATVFSASNVGAGSVAVKPLTITAGIETNIPYPNTVYLIGDGTTKNYTWSVGSMTGQYKVTVIWEEYN